MMKSKFKAGLVASIISLVVVVAAAIAITEWTNGRTGDRLVKIIAFGVIGIWLALYNWFKPKAENPNQNQPTEKNQSQSNSENDETAKNRNSYN